MRAMMKTRLLTAACVVTIGLAGATPGYAYTRSDAATVAADALLARPLCLAATVVGSAIFVVSLPLAATSRSVRPTAEVLVLRPARATFVRPMGDFNSPAQQEKESDSKKETAEPAQKPEVAPAKK